ncbi:hypothetical protein C8R47DRAFT_1267246 [Mycena vitilis]|nr:hypothetical protein C8R47DRAFT_1267246 [Mycena vitilis]
MHRRVSGGQGKPEEVPNWEGSHLVLLQHSLPPLQPLRNTSTSIVNTLWHVIKLDPDYIASNWNQTGFDLWEEIKSSSFFTTAVQHRSLREAESQPTPPLPVATGRYPEDVYTRGNPWYLTTAAVAELLYDALIVWKAKGSLNVTTISLPFFKQFQASSSPPPVTQAGTVPVTFGDLQRRRDHREWRYLTGSVDALQNWFPDNAMVLSPANYPTWSITFNVPESTLIEYKYIRKLNGVLTAFAHPSPSPSSYACLALQLCRRALFATEGNVQQLIFILELFFPPELAMQQALYVLAVLISLYPVLRLHSNQINEARRQNPQTGWKKSIHTLLTRAFHEEANNVEAWTTGINLAPEYSNYICRDLDRLYILLGVGEDGGDLKSHLTRPARLILTTSRLDCRFCPPGDRNLIPSLRRRAGKNRKKPNQHIWVLDATFQWVSADLIVAGSRQRTQLLEYDAMYIRVSKHGTWAHRNIALAQEKAVQRLHCGWSNFADWVNDITADINHQLSYRQAQKLFVEHFARRLLVAHGESETFTCDAHARTKILTAAVHGAIGENGGIIPGAMDHGCMDCTHVKRYGAPLLNAGSAADVVDSEAGPAGPLDPALVEGHLPPNMPEFVPMQDSPPPGAPLGYERLSVMDGKTVTHKVANAKTHCTITRTVDSAKNTYHNAWFAELSLAVSQSAPSLQVQLQALGDTPGDQVVHSFKAKTIYCLQTIQWACGVPIGWGKCYKSESTPQVLAFLNKVWEDYPEKRPGFIVYDKACDLLRHIATQNINDSWIASTKFIVDAWHYIGHRATDILCRTRCNPAPSDGSQPDLVITQVDDNGVAHQARAFNTETAEQLNSWISGYESQLRQMTDVNYDFYIHVLMMMYGEMVEKRVVSKHRELSDEFWDEVNGTTIDLDLE